MSEVFDRINARCKNAADKGEKRITLQLTDLAELLKDHPKYMPERDAHVDKILTGKEDRLMEKRRSLVKNGKRRD
jgi:hypothetical protein